MNTDAPWPSIDDANARVLKIQTNLHRWSTGDANRRFDDLSNLVSDPAFLTVAWNRVKANRGRRSAGVDSQTVYSIREGIGVEKFLRQIRASLRDRTFRPMSVRERLIPKAGSEKKRRLGIPVVRDRVVQAALKLVLEPIFEADFSTRSFGFRPNRRAQDAIAEIHRLCSRSYEWIVEGDIKACFDEIDHTALMDRVRRRIGDKRILALVKSFCKSGILRESGRIDQLTTGTPQGGILSPLLANIALSVLDCHFDRAWEKMGATSSARQAHRRKGLATYRLVRYADDFVILVAGTKAHADELRTEAARALGTVGLTLSSEKTRISHIDKGFDFLGFRIQRRLNRSNQRRYVYTWPSRKSLASIKRTVRTLSRTGYDLPLRVFLVQVNRAMGGWGNYFRHGVSKATFCYLRAYSWRRVICWLRHKHPRLNWNKLRRRYLHGWWPVDNPVRLFDISSIPVTRYRCRTNIATPWAAA